MNRREFLEKFVALSSISLILAGCVGKEEHVVYPEANNKNVKFKDIISEPKRDQPMAVYGPPPVYDEEPKRRRQRPIIGN